MTALQVIIKEAQAIRRKSPKMEWKKAVAQASAIYANKHKGKSPVGKKHAKKKSVKRKVGAVKKAAKKVVKKVVRKKAVKKVVRKKAAKKVVRSLHKDTASHNVKISVVSGLGKAHRSHNQEMIKKYNDLKNEILKQEQYLDNWKHALVVNKKFPANKIIVRNRISEIKKYISELKTHAREVKKII